MNSRPTKPAELEARWVPIYPASRMFLQQSASVTYRQIKAGRLIAKEVDGKRYVDALSFPYEAKCRWKEWELRNVLGPDARSVQGSLFPEIESDKRSLAAVPSEWDRMNALRRVRIFQPGENHDFAALGHDTKRALRQAIEKETGVAERTQQRWAERYRKYGLPGLIDGIPGPKKGTGGILDDSAKGFLEIQRGKNRSYRQCYVDYIDYLGRKQGTPGCTLAHHYRPTSYATVYRFLCSLDSLDKAAREGPDAMKAACGHLDRTYEKLRSLDRVECDEWKYNLFAFDPEHPRKVYRYWLLLFLDIRSRYPLVWKIVRGSDTDTRHGISEEDEIELTEKLIRQYGVPRELSTDRGRFRGNTWGGSPTGGARDAQFQKADGILGSLGITYNRPRESNPRAMPVHPLFLFLSNQCQGLPGYIGRNTVERKHTSGDAEKAEHFEWLAGRRGIKSPLLSLPELSTQTEEWIELWRDHPSEGTDMRGLSPRAVFVHNTPPEGFRRISDEELVWHTAERFDVLIGKGGIIQLRDGKRYSDPQLLLIIGERREVARARHDHEQISVLPAAKGEEDITAKRRVRVGVNDPDELSRQMELQARLRKLAGAMVKPLDYDPGAQFPDAELKSEPPKSAQVINPSESIAAQQAPPPAPESEVSSVEFLMEHDRYKSRVKPPLDFADLEG